MKGHIKHIIVKIQKKKFKGIFQSFQKANERAPNKLRYQTSKLAHWKLKHNRVMPSKIGQKIMSNLGFYIQPYYYSVMDNTVCNPKEW